MAEGRDDRSLGELFADLASQTGTLVRQELRQAGTEISQRATGVGKDIGVLAAGAVVLHAAFLAIVAAIILGLADLGSPGGWRPCLSGWSLLASATFWLDVPAQPSRAQMCCPAIRWSRSGRTRNGRKTRSSDSIATRR